LDSIFITGTAGSGKSLLTSRLCQWYKDNNFFPAIVNLDPAVSNLPYEVDVDIRNYINVNEIMEEYDLGPNGAIIMANDIIATKINEIQDEIDEINPDYLLIDTPGQIELFAYRASGPFIISNLESENKMAVFLMDGVLLSNPTNFVSLSLLSISINLRLNIPQINTITKRDLIIEKLEKIMNWTNISYLDDDLFFEKSPEYSLLSLDIMKYIRKTGIMQEIIPVSNITSSGMIELFASISRILNQGEEVKY